MPDKEKWCTHSFAVKLDAHPAGPIEERATAAGSTAARLRQRGVRLIAINDGVDSANGESDFTSFLNIMYEFYTEIPAARLNRYSRQRA